MIAVPRGKADRIRQRMMEKTFKGVGERIPHPESLLLINCIVVDRVFTQKDKKVKKWDILNKPKATCDTLGKALGFDDSLIIGGFFLKLHHSSLSFSLLELWEA